METITIRRVQLDDLPALQFIGRSTFKETFSTSNTETDMNSYLEEGFSDEKLSTELKDANAEFYFAVSNNEVLGYLKVNFGDSQTELKDHHALEVERIYVANAFHGKGVGQILLDKAIELAKEKIAEYVWLGVWEENPRAIQFYEKNGFIVFGEHLFKLGNDEQTDLLMKRML